MEENGRAHLHECRQRLNERMRQLKIKTKRILKDYLCCVFILKISPGFHFQTLFKYGVYLIYPILNHNMLMYCHSDLERS